MLSCFHSVGLPNRSLLEAIDLVADAGYQAIELNAETLPWAPAHITPETDAKTRQSFIDACKAHGLGIPAVGAHIPMVGADERERKAAIAYVNGCTDVAWELKSPVVHILSGPLGGGVDREEAWRWFRAAVEETTAYAVSRNLHLGIEAIAGHLFCGTDDYHRLRKELPGVPFKVNYDPSHLQVQGENPRRVIDELGDLIVHVHLKDGSGRFPNFKFPPLGKGDINFADLADGLRKAGYADAMSVEYEAQVFGYHESEAQILRDGRAFYESL
jgi:sugar phosphate isomerase/epimerase